MKKYSFKIEEKWSSKILDHGFTAIPNLLMSNRIKLGMNSTDIYVLICLESYRWDTRKHPFPSVETLAERVGLSSRQVGRSTRNLVKLGLIEKRRRFAQSNTYNLEPLVENLERCADEYVAAHRPSISLHMGYRRPPNNTYPRIQKE